MMMTSIDQWRKKQNLILIDSDISTNLKDRGINLNTDLWTADALVKNPKAVKLATQDAFDAHSNIVVTDTYQASVPGLLKVGYSKEKAKNIIQKSVQLAKSARSDSKSSQDKWIAGAIGSYGAYLADGSEYRGDYQISDQALNDFHIQRLKYLIDAGCDLIAFETIPKFQELKVLCKLLKQFPNIKAFFSCSIKDEHHISDGTDLKIVQDYLKQQKQIITYGFNCCHPSIAAPALQYLRSNADTDQDLITFPNAGGKYDPNIKDWTIPSEKVFLDQAPKWQSSGAKWIGGCCDVSVNEFRKMYDRLKI